MGPYPAIAAARERSGRIDDRVVALAGALPAPFAVVALAAYGRRQLTPHGDLEVLFLHIGQLSTAEVTQTVAFPMWENGVRFDALVRTPDEFLTEARRSWSVVTRFLDARLIAGDTALFEDLQKRMQLWTRDRDRLRHHLRADAQHRHSVHPPATGSATPDLIAGRGGLMDLHALRWLQSASATEQAPADPEQREHAGAGRTQADPEQPEHPDMGSTQDALEFLLRTIQRAEDLLGHPPQRLSPRILQRLNLDATFFKHLYGHARWVAFLLDGALTPPADSRQLGPSLAIRDGKLVADRPPPLDRAPSFGLRVANVVGLAPPSPDLMRWSSMSGTEPFPWDESATEQFWLLLRAADWRAFDFLDVSSLLIRYLPELQHIWRVAGSARTGDLALDTHSFLALRALHEWTEGDDVLARRAWRSIRNRDWVYLAVLLHELSPPDAAAAARRVGLPPNACHSIESVSATYQFVLDTATRRDLNDEDLLLDLATRIGTRQRLSTTFLVAVAHELACGATAWSPWKADLMRQLFGHLEVALRQPHEAGIRRTRLLEQRRERIVRELTRKQLYSLAPLVARLPRRYVLTRTPALAARHVALLGRRPLGDGEVRIEARRRREPGLWDLLIVARDRPGLLATLAGVLALRGISVLAADAATSADGLVLDVFTVGGAEEVQWPRVEADLQLALRGRIPLHDLLGSRPLEPEEAASLSVSIDNAASQFFSLVEVRAPDRVGLLYRIADALHAQGLDIHHARIATHPEGALDVFYVRDLSGAKLSESTARDVVTGLTSRLRGLP